MTEISIVIAFLAGIGSFFAPCILPMVPAFLAYISGTTLSEVKQRIMLFLLTNQMYF